MIAPRKKRKKKVNGSKATEKNILVRYDAREGGRWAPLIKIGTMRMQLPVRRMKILAESDYTIIGQMIADEVYKHEYGENRLKVTLKYDGVEVEHNKGAQRPPLMEEII